MTQWLVNAAAHPAQRRAAESTLCSPPVRFGAKVVLERCLVDEVAGAGDAKVLAVSRQVLIQLHPAERHVWASCE